MGGASTSSPMGEEYVTLTNNLAFCWEWEGKNVLSENYIEPYSIMLNLVKRFEWRKGEKDDLMMVR